MNLFKHSALSLYDVFFFVMLDLFYFTTKVTTFFLVPESCSRHFVKSRF